MVIKIHRQGVEILKKKKARVTQLAAIEARCLVQPDMSRSEALRFARSLNRRMSEAKKAVRK